MISKKIKQIIVGVTVFLLLGLLVLGATTISDSTSSFSGDLNLQKNNLYNVSDINTTNLNSTRIVTITLNATKNVSVVENLTVYGNLSVLNNISAAMISSVNFKTNNISLGGQIFMSSSHFIVSTGAGGSVRLNITTGGDMYMAGTLTNDGVLRVLGDSYLGNAGAIDYVYVTGDMNVTGSINSTKYCLGAICIDTWDEINVSTSITGNYSVGDPMDATAESCYQYFTTGVLTSTNCTAI